MSSASGVTVGFDGSGPATIALDWAVAYARSHGLPLRVLVGLQVPVRMASYTPFPVPDLREAAAAEAHRAVTQALARCAELAPDVEVTGAVVDETPIRALLQASHGSQLVVVGSRGLSPLADAVLGSVSTALSAHAHGPIVVVRGSRTADPAAPVVAGIDGSERDDATLAAAFDEAARRNVRLIVAHAWSDAPLVEILGAASGAWPTWDRLRDGATALVEQELDGWRAKYPTVAVDVRVICDQPAPALLALAQAAGLVVVGSHGRGGFAGMVLGSVARRLVQHADCPVLVVRHPVPPVPTTKE